MVDDLADRAPFAGGDQDYLRQKAYGDSRKLSARARLHLEFSTATQTMAAFEAGLIEWPTDGNLLECGAGTGLFWRSGIPPRSLAVTITDLAEGMVAEATSAAEANGYEVRESRSCDVQHLPFETNSFDVVVANHMLYHVPDPGRAVAELARVLKPEGVALVATNGFGHMDVINEIVAEVFEKPDERLYDVFGIDSGERRLREAFGSISWHAFKNDLVVDDPQAVIDYVLSFPPGEDATEAERSAIAAAVNDRFSGGSIRIRTRAGAFVNRLPL